MGDEDFVAVFFEVPFGYKIMGIKYDVSRKETICL